MLIFDPAQILNVHDEPQTYNLEAVGLFIELLGQVFQCDAVQLSSTLVY